MQEWGEKKVGQWKVSFWSFSKIFFKIKNVRKLELELEGASNFRVVNIFGGVRVRDCKYFSMENENQLESIGNYHR